MCLLSLRFFLHTSERIIKTMWSTLIDMILNLTITLMCIPVLSVGIKRQDKTKLFSTEFILIFVLSNNFHALFWNPLLTPRVCSHEDHNLSQRSNYRPQSSKIKIKLGVSFYYILHKSMTNLLLFWVNSCRTTEGLLEAKLGYFLFGEDT